MFTLDDKLIFEAYSEPENIKAGDIVEIQMRRSDWYDGIGNTHYGHELNGELAIITRVNKDSYSFKLLKDKPDYAYKHIAIQKQCVRLVSRSKLDDPKDAESLGDLLSM
jgi:hypothetical protein